MQSKNKNDTLEVKKSELSSSDSDSCSLSDSDLSGSELSGSDLSGSDLDFNSSDSDSDQHEKEKKADSTKNVDREKLRYLRSMHPSWTEEQFAKCLGITVERFKEISKHW